MSLAISSNKKIDFTNEDVKNAFFEKGEILHEITQFYLKKEAECIYI